MDLLELVQSSQFKTIERLWWGLLRSYFRIDVEGLENLPRKGGALIMPNHAGFSGADAALLTYVIKRETRRRARILAHRAYFDFSKTLKAVSESHGLRRASLSEGTRTLESGQLLIVFPEGEAGNFKPSLRRYRLQPFHTGFLRMAIPARAPVVPCVIIGAEETHLSIGNINLSRIARNMRIPLPVNWFPLPAKWTIAFLPAIDLATLYPDPEVVRDSVRLRSEARNFQVHLQKAIRARLKKRRYVYYPETRKLLNRILSRWDGR